ncbi:MAG: MBL fold metallo-hydrolase [Deltaproteobacteria bacterium]|nr:MAG: MBL fold metallo-hydrolase [Deltaproteobacteria bacterium]
MNLALTTLCENTAGKPGFMAEWGLSVLVQADGMNVLFDTGGNVAAVRNADKLGVDLRAVDTIVLSHAHADHTGGLREVLMRTGPKEIIAHPAIWELKYVKRAYEKKEAFIGVPFTRAALEQLGASFTLRKDPVCITDTIVTTGEIGQTTDFEGIEPIFYVKEDGSLRKDHFPDDLALIVRTKEGLVIVLGCAHRGMISTIRHAQMITGEQRVHTVVGGTHLFPKTDEQIEKAIHALQEIGVQKIGVSHCTGFHASVRLAEVFGDTFFQNNAGTVYTLDSV